MIDPTLILIIINCVVYAIPYIIPFGGPYNSLGNFQELGIMNRTDVSSGEWYRLLTSNFLHADIMHLFVNMYSLYNVGGSVLNFFKPFGFGVIYIVSGIVGSLFSYLFGNYGFSRGSLGASGAIMGLLGSLLAYSIIAQRYDILSVIFINLVIVGLYGFLIPQIDNWGHLGGLVAGFVLGLVLLVLRPYS